MALDFTFDPVRILLRHDTAANWTSANPTLSAGEAGVETDTHKIKFGDGSTAWTSLAYMEAAATVNTGSSTNISGVLYGSGSTIAGKTIVGTTNQVTVTLSSPSITLSLPQDINAAAMPTFSTLYLSSSTASTSYSTGALTVLGGAGIGGAIHAGGRIVSGNTALLTTATDPFLWLAGMPGAPTGAPTAPYTGAVALTVDTTNSKLYMRIGGSWIDASSGSYSVFGASGGSHSTGLVPDPGASAGSTKFLREDATWAVPAGGSMGGSTGATDNRLLRADGTGGSTVQNSAVTVGDSGEISGFTENQVTVSGTTYTIDSSSVSGSVFRFTSASAVTVTLANSIPAGFVCSWRQVGAGQITFSAGASATLQNRSSHTKSAGQYACGGLACDSNAGSAAIVYLMGDTAA